MQAKEGQGGFKKHLVVNRRANACCQCDQQQPKCARCVRRDSECTYRHLMTNYNPFSMQQLQQGGQGPAISAPPAPTYPATSMPPARRTSQGFRYVFHTPEDNISSVRATEEPFIKIETPAPLAQVASPATPFIKTESTPAPDTGEGSFYPPKSTPSVSSYPIPDTTAGTESTIETKPSLVSFSTEQDAFLMHHYTTNLTTPAMSPILESNIFPSLNEAILRHAQTVPYVWHVVLAFSGLHLASYSPMPQSANYLYTALEHKQAALNLFMPAIAEGITPQTAEPQLAASAVLVACCLALPAADPGRKMSFDRIDILAEVAGLFQGTNHIYHHNAYKMLPRKPSSASSSSCDSSSPSSAPRSPGDNVPWPEAMESLRRCIDRLHALLPTQDPEEEKRRNVLDHAASRLQRAFGKVSEARRDFNVLCVWLGMVDLQFVRLIQTRDPIALLLLAHWAVCRTNMDDIWWARGWPATAVGAIHEALDLDHRPLLDWCVSQARGRAPSMGHHGLVEIPANQSHLAR